MKAPKLQLRPRDSVGQRKRANLFQKLIEWEWSKLKGYKVWKIPGVGVFLKLKKKDVRGKYKVTVKKGSLPDRKCKTCLGVGNYATDWTSFKKCFDCDGTGRILT